MFALVVYCAAMIWAVVRLSNRSARLHEQFRTEGYRLAWYCGRNPHDPRHPLGAR